MAKKSSGAIALSDDNRWKVERDLETLMECKRIEADPKRLAAAKALAKEKMMDAATVASGDSD